MSVTNIAKKTLATRTLPAAAAVSIPTWVRPSSWLTLPTITDADQKFVGLYAVYEEGNFVALSATGAYVINWGDGTGDINVASGVQAEYNIPYANVAGNTDVGIADAFAVTFQDTGDTVTKAAHGFLNGQKIAFSSITSTTGISTYTNYYIVNKTTDTFQVASTQGGTALVLTTDGTGSAYVPQYRQVVITLTMQSGQTLTELNLHKKHSQTNLSAYDAPWLDIAIAGASMSSLLIGVKTAGIATQVISLGLLQRVTLYANLVTSMSYMFGYCRALQSIPLLNTASVTSMSNMFYDCRSLQTIPLLNTASVTNMYNMFNSCYSLQSIPLLNTASVTNMHSMFYDCRSLQTIPLLNTASVTSMSNMFYSCYALLTIPLLNTASVTDMSYMFYICYSLRTIPLLNTASVTSMIYMFYNCRSLQTIPLLNTASVTNMSNIFAGCTSLRTISLLNTALVTTMTNMFNSCSSLQSVPAMSASAAISSTSYSGMFTGCSSLSEINMTGFKYTFSVASCKLSAEALNKLYGNLAIAAAQVLTVTYNYGITGDNPSIATAKSWTVSGS